MEIVVVLVGAVILLLVYWRGRSNGYHDGYYKGHAEGVEAAKIDAAKFRSTESTIRIARAAFNRGYRKGLNEKASS